MTDKSYIKADGKINRAAARLSLALAMLIVMLMASSGLEVYAAVAPTLSVNMGTPWSYTVSGKNVASVKYGTASPEASKMNTVKNGNTFKISETGANKQYELGYIPIVASMDVPASTTYQTTFTFSAVGDKNGTGSALTVMEVYDFGASDRSSELTFNMADNATPSGSYTKMRSRTKDEKYNGTYTVTVSFSNTTDREKTVYHYFGFFAGVHYGSSKNHQLDAACTVAYSRIADDAEITPQINASSSDLHHYISTNSDGNTLAASRFLREKENITQAEAADLNMSQGGMNNHDAWGHSRLRLSIEQNKLTLAQSNGYTTHGNKGYIPFTVPISVPAHTTRTYYLTFDIYYERNTGSGAGFFAELIKGGVPEYFNTSTNATPTGNTLLRVYSSGGDAHSGRVEVPVTLTNDTENTKVFQESYVFFVGYRRVGVYTPEPSYSLTLTDISSASYEDVYGVTVNTTNCTYTAPNEVSMGQDCTVTFSPDNGYSLPNAVTVQIGNRTQVAADYTFNSSTGQLTIPAKLITDNVVVTAAAVGNSYNVTLNNQNATASGTNSVTATYGSAMPSITLPKKTGYTFGGYYTGTNGGGTQYYNSSGTSAKNWDKTSSATLYAKWTPLSNTITYKDQGGGAFSGTHVSGYPTTHTYGTATPLKSPTKVGYTFGGWYANSSCTGTALTTLSATGYTSNITLYAKWIRLTYSAALSGNNVTAASGFGSGAASHNIAWTGTIRANSGYVLPNSISVTVGGKALSNSAYTYNKADGTIKLAANYVTGNIVVTASGHKHSYTSTVTKAASCTADGVRTYTCSCGHSYTENIPATGHKWNSKWEFDDKIHWHACANGCGAVSDSAEHSFAWVVDREPTVTTVGLRHEECTACRYSKAQEEFTADIVVVEISWGELSFTYNEGEWNTDTLRYDVGGWEPDREDGNLVTVKNAGNVNVEVSVTYTAQNNTVFGSFVNDDNAPVAAPIELPIDKELRFRLILTGKPKEEMSQAKLGVITVKLGGD